MARLKIQTPCGLADILEENLKIYQFIEKVCQKAANFYNFKRIETPILEKKELFEKGIGEATEIVEKEMYSFKTKGGDKLCLRPEGTAPIVRAYFQNGMQGLPQPVRLWYFGPFFRHEKPQHGRKRQFWQFGFELLNSADPIAEILILKLFIEILRELKIQDFILEINSIGDENCQPYFKKALTQYFKGKAKSLCQNCREKLGKNVFRILDCKEEKCKIICAQAPQSLDYLCEDCKSHFKKILEYLDELKIPYYLNPHLVRGLDYYCKTVFEIFPKDEERLALIGGGRYDNLGKILFKEKLPAVGGSGGIERIILYLEKKNIKLIKEKKPQVFLAIIGEMAKIKGLEFLDELREEKIKVIDGFGKDSLKSQLRLAEKLGAKFVLILGEKEAREGVVLFKDMEKGKQEIVSLKEAKKRIKKLCH